MATTQLGLYGGPQQPYGSFAGKVAAGGVGTEQHTRLGLYGGPRGLYGSFAGKTAGGVGTEQHTRLGLYGGPRGLYGDFSGKTAAVVVVPPAVQPADGGGALSGPGYGGYAARRHQEWKDRLEYLKADDEEALLVIIAALEEWFDG